MTELEVKAAVRERDGFRCVYCGMNRQQHFRTYGKDLDVHRKVPGSNYTVDACETVCRQCHGPLPRRRHKARTRELIGQGKPVPVLIASEIYEKVQLICVWRRVKISKYLSETLADIVDQDYGKFVEDINGRKPGGSP